MNDMTQTLNVRVQCCEQGMRGRVRVGVQKKLHFQESHVSICSGTSWGHHRSYCDFIAAKVVICRFDEYELLEFLSRTDIAATESTLG